MRGSYEPVSVTRFANSSKDALMENYLT
jgi:hypothetical protein